MVAIIIELQNLTYQQSLSEDAALYVNVRVAGGE